MGKPYYDAVLWAYYHEPQPITGGYGDGTFRPNEICKRWAVVLFMYRDLK